MDQPVEHRCIADIRVVAEPRWPEIEPGWIEPDEARRIGQEGLRRPILITAEGELIHGIAALRVYRDDLGRSEIPVRVVDLDGIISGSYSGDQLRAEFEPAERAGIRRMIERRLVRPDVLAALSA
jgi:hypothetical protein